MKVGDKIELGFIFTIVIGLPISFYVGYIFNLKYELVRINSYSLLEEYYVANIESGFLACMLFLVVISSLMFELDKHMNGSN